MATFGDMQARIADELGMRTDLIPQIQKAILTTIAQQDNDHYYFNELSATFQTVAKQAYYTPSTLFGVSGIASNSWLKIAQTSGYNYQLTRWNFQEMDAIDTNASWAAMPYAWAYYNYQMRLFPVPQQVYTVTGFFVVEFAPLNLAADSNPWTNDAEEMIRSFAKADLYSNVLLAEPNAQQLSDRMIARGRAAKKSLRQQTTKLNTSGYVRNSWCR